MSNFDSDPLTCDPALFPAKNTLNSAKSIRIFPGKRRRDRALILTYLDSPMTEVFPHPYLFFQFRPSSGERFQGSKLDQNCKF